MKIYKIHKKIQLNISKEAAWDFFSDPNNLRKLMPDDMKFEVISGADSKAYAGQIIQYWVKPLQFYKTKWVTEITQVQKPNYFVDNQLYGPYKLWHHKHFFYAIEGGVMVEDIVHYALPFGFIGSVLHPYIIKPKLEKIFNTRTEKLQQLFEVYQSKL